MDKNYGIDTGDIFEWNRNPDLYRAPPQPNEELKPASIVINQGGMASGKTYAIMQVLFLHCIEQPNIYCQVFGRYLTSLKKDAIRIAQDIVKTCPTIADHVLGFNKSESFFTFRNGSVIKFSDLDSPDKGKGAKSDYSYISEANHIKKEAFDEVQSRTKIRTYIDYNPNARFWAHDLIGLPHVVFFRSYYMHNPFLWERNAKGQFLYDATGARIPHKQNNIVNNILNRIEDKAWYKVYGLGFTGKTEGLVFKKTRKVAAFPCDYRDEDLPQKAIGIDFGWSRDQTAIVLVAPYKNEIFVEELAYATHLTDDDIVNVLLKAIADGKITKNTPIFGDPAAGGDQVVDNVLKAKHGFRRAEKAQKPAGSIEAGISWLNKLDSINILSTSFNVWAEIMAYIYLDDPNKPNKPIDKKNHAMDALRYAIYWLIYKPAPRRIVGLSN